MNLSALIWIFLQIIRSGLSGPSSYGGVKVDRISGELVKPVSMSEERFTLIKSLRIRDIVNGELVDDEDDQVEGRTKRVRREAEIQSSLPATISQGFYKEKVLVLEQYSGLSDVMTESIVADLVRIHTFNNGNVTKKIGFFVKQDSSTGASVELREWTGTNWQELGPISDSFNSLLNFDSIPEAKITDVHLIQHPQTLFTFVCVTVDYAVDYPRSTGHSIHTNDPVDIPTEAKSVLFRFDLTSIGYTLSMEMYLDTYRAQDAESWCHHHRCYLGIAEYGSSQVQEVASSSSIWVQMNLDTPTYTEMKLEDEQFSDHANKMVHFLLNDRSYLVIASLGSATGNNTYNNQSPVYMYNYNSRQYKLLQRLPTFGATDVAFIPFKDPYPLYSRFFLTFTSNKNDGIDEDAEAIVYSYSKGRFIPFQSLPVLKSRSVVASSNLISTTSSTSTLKSNHLQHLVAFLSEDGQSIAGYQYNGNNFVQVFNSSTTGSQLELADLGSTESPQPVLIISSSGSSVVLVKEISFNSSSYTDDSNSRLYQCLQEKAHRRTSRNFRNLKKTYDKAPKKLSAFNGKLHLETLVMSSNSTLSVTEIDINSNLTAEPSNFKLSVGDATVDAEYFIKIGNLSDTHEILSQQIQAEEVKIAQGEYVFTDRENQMSGPLSITTLEGEELSGSSMFHNGKYVSLSDSGRDLEGLLDNIVIIKPDATNLLTDAIDFENISLVGNYDVSSIGDVSVSNIATAGDADGLDISGTVTVDSVATFNNTLEVTDKINNEFYLDSSNILLKTGEQTFNVPVKITHAAEFDKLLSVSTFNNLDMMAALQNSMNVEDDFSINEPVIIDNLEINGNVQSNIGAINDDLSVDQIDFSFLLENSLKKSVNNDIVLAYNFKTLEATNFTAPEVSNASWPSEYVAIDDSSESLVHPSRLIFKVLNTDNGKIAVATHIESNQNGLIEKVIVGADNNLDLLSVTTEPANYPREVTGLKTFSEVRLKADSLVSGSVFDFDMPTLNNYAAAGATTISDPVEVGSVNLSGKVTIDHLELNDLSLKTGCSGTGGCVLNDLTLVYQNGIKRDAAELPVENSYNFEQAAFTKNLNILNLNELDPETDYIPIDGIQERTVEDEITFKSEVLFVEDLKVQEGGKMKTCDKNNDQSICKLDEDGGCCKLDSNSNCRCSLMSNQVCVITNDFNNVDLCNFIHMEDLNIIDQNSLKRGEKNVIKNSVVLKGGLISRSIDIQEDCNLNGLDCSKLVSTIHQETLTGQNTVNGLVVTKGVTRINTDLTVSLAVDDVNIQTLYTDSLFHSTLVNQVLSGRSEFTETIQVQDFTSNGVNVGTVSASDLTDLSQFVLNAPGDVNVCGGMKFDDSLSTIFINATTWNQINVESFYNELWTTGVQDIFGDVRIRADATFSGSLTSNLGNSTVNEISLQEINSKAVGSTGTSKITLNNVNFNVFVAMTDKRGILLENSFLGVNLQDDSVLRYNPDPTIFTGEKKFQKLHIEGNVDVEESTISILSNDKSASVEIFYLCEYTANTTLNKVEVSGNLIIDNEPVIDSINNNNLNSLKSSHWCRQQPFTANYPLFFDNLELRESVEFTSNNAFVNNLGLLHWRDNYMSLLSDQTVNANCQFTQGLDLALPVHVPSTTLSSLNQELDITTNNVSLNIKSLRESVLFKNTSYSDVLTVLVFDNVETAGCLVSLDGKLNDFDTVDLITYLSEDSKEFPETVSIQGNLVANDFNINDLKIPATAGISEMHTGFNLENEQLGLDLVELFTNSIKADESSPGNVAGNKTFSGELDFSVLTTSSLNELVFGTCEDTKMLLSEPCSGTNSQEVEGSWKFGTSENLSKVYAENFWVSEELPLVNNINLTEIMAKAVFKSLSTELGTITAQKTFNKPLTLGDATLEGNVFGIKVDSVVTQTLRVADMSYASGATTPNVTGLIDGIQDDIETVKEFIYTPVLGIAGEGVKKIFPIVSTSAEDKFRIAGLSQNALNAGTLELFELFDDVVNTASEVTATLSLDVQFSRSFDKISMVSVPVSDGSRIIVFNGVLVTSLETLGVADFDLPSHDSSFDYLSALHVLDDEVRYTQIHSNAGVVDMSTVQLEDRHCIVLCGYTGTSILCLDLNLQFSLTSVIDTNLCMKVSTVNRITPEQDDNNLIFILDQEEEDLLKCFKYSSNSNSFSLIGTPLLIESNTNKDNFQLGTFRDDEESESRNFIVTWLSDQLRVHLYDQEANIFQLLSNFDLVLTMKAHFYEFEGNFYLSVLHGTTSKSILSTFVYRSVLGFIHEKAQDIELRGVTSFEPMAYEYLQDRFVLTSGALENPASTLPASAIYRYARKDDKIARRRKEFEFKGRLPTLPVSLSMGCNEMVHNYLSRRYLENQDARDGFNIEKIGQLALHLMPRQFIEYKSEDFFAVQEYLEDERFTHLQERAPLTAAANLYRYEEDETRAFNDDTFVGTLTVFQFEDSLYTYGKLKREKGVTDPIFRALSFWTNCSTEATKFNVDSFDEAGLQPVAEDDPYSTDVHQCSMFYNLPSTFADKLQTLDNKAFAGGVIVHSGDSTSSSRFACGILKNPTQARFQFYQDHPDLAQSNPVK